MAGQTPARLATPEAEALAGAPATCSVPLVQAAAARAAATSGISRRERGTARRYPQAGADPV